MTPEQLSMLKICLDWCIDIFPALDPGVHRDDPRLARQSMQSVYDRHKGTLRQIRVMLEESGEGAYKLEEGMNGYAD